MSVKEKIKQAALDLGFSQIGFARAEKLPEAPLLEWLLRGYHGTMDYMSRAPHARLDPREILPGCRTVISLSVNYYTPFPTKSSANEGRISRYAWGKDYHKVLHKKLKKLVGRLAELAPLAKTKICVDTSPLMEKAWAQKAGIGWQGKNGNILSKENGSWIFLGEILTDLDVEPDKPHADFCGTCNRCIDACPTGAIVSPYVVDGSRCISYLTIEAKEVAKGELAEKSGDWIFGCDICQEVCPWNRFASVTEEENFFPKLENQIPLETWLNFNEEEFKEKFAGTPLMRPKKEHMARNAATAIRNLSKENEKE